ncbi:unnamed protein product [Arabidopsis lyrata]|uniref:uncharacterized protein LOC9326176 n=1 Tax=Arabidopsis lyrata subsp. lyrata TaxID=81972 RepID=UPI000A29B75B|nr:uncharacterized protein LOC9326176 [Arabidopsis lyrata subsp. lyrata]CAH8252438.1 unnamed protein product [Arabidopsis lyrata]|eukprot:XP_020870341.1 uncharacterized protein LOC9326176 [Arabidopsis lyrata subsp. lyrata]
MEVPLLTENDHIVDNVTTHGDSSSNDERILDILTMINGSSSSAAKQIPYEWSEYSIDAFSWNFVEFVATLVKIVAAIVVLTLTKDEQLPQKIFVMLVISYTCGCIATLPILGWRFLQYDPSVRSHRRINEVMDNLKMMLGYFFVGWITVVLWHLLNNSSSLDYTTSLFWLCLAFFAISCILQVFRHFYCSVMCFLLPMLSRFTKVLDFLEDIDEKLNYIVLALFVCISIFLCIRKS